MGHSADLRERGARESGMRTLGQAEFTATRASTALPSATRVCLWNSKRNVPDVEPVRKFLTTAAIVTSPFPNGFVRCWEKFHVMPHTLGHLWNSAVVSSLISAFPCDIKPDLGLE